MHFVAFATKEFRPDSSIWETRYDAFRDARLIDGLYRSTAQAFDKMGRSVQITRPAAETWRELPRRGRIEEMAD